MGQRLWPEMQQRRLSPMFVVSFVLSLEGKRTTTTKYFRSFRVQCYKQHLCNKHQEEWTQYQYLSNEEKKNYFDNRQVVANTLHAHIDIGQDRYVFQINRGIVDVIIGELLFDPDDDDGEVSRERVLALFSLQNDAAEEKQAEDACSHNEVDAEASFGC